MNPPTPTTSRPKGRFPTQTLPASKATNACTELIGKRSRCPNSTFRPRWRGRMNIREMIEPRFSKIEEELGNWRKKQGDRRKIGVVKILLFALIHFLPKEHIWEQLKNIPLPPPSCLCAPLEPQKPPIFPPYESFFRLRQRRGRRAD